MELTALLLAITIIAGVGIFHESPKPSQGVHVGSAMIEYAKNIKPSIDAVIEFDRECLKSRGTPRSVNYFEINSTATTNMAEVCE